MYFKVHSPTGGIIRRSTSLLNKHSFQNGDNMSVHMLFVPENWQKRKRVFGEMTTMVYRSGSPLSNALTQQRRSESVLFNVFSSSINCLYFVLLLPVTCIFTM